MILVIDASIALAWIYTREKPAEAEYAAHDTGAILATFETALAAAMTRAGGKLFV